MNARDELADKILRLAIYEGREGTVTVAEDRDSHEYLHCQTAADAILAAGWRPPARTIETTEELDALPDSTLIRSNGRNEQFTGRVYRVKSVGMVERVGRELDGVTPFRYFVDPLPATVIYEPCPGHAEGAGELPAPTPT